MPRPYNRRGLTATGRDYQQAYGRARRGALRALRLLHPLDYERLLKVQLDRERARAEA